MCARVCLGVNGGHSKGNHAKYLALSVVKALRLLLHTRVGKVLKVNTQKCGTEFLTHTTVIGAVVIEHMAACARVMQRVLVVSIFLSVLKSKVREGP